MESRRTNNATLAYWLACGNGFVRTVGDPRPGEPTYIPTRIGTAYTFNEEDSDAPVPDGITVRRWADRHWHEPTPLYLEPGSPEKLYRILSDEFGDGVFTFQRNTILPGFDILKYRGQRINGGIAPRTDVRYDTMKHRIVFDTPSMESGAYGTAGADPWTMPDYVLDRLIADFRMAKAQELADSEAQHE